MTFAGIGFKCRNLLLFCALIGLCGLVYGSWDGPVQTIEREETIQEANEEAAAQNDAAQIDQNKIEDEKNTIEKRDPHAGHNSATWLSINLLYLAPFGLLILRRI